MPRVSNNTYKIYDKFLNDSVMPIYECQKKYVLFQTQVSYLGHIVSNQGVSTDQEKVDCVKHCPVPKTVKEVRQFLGLCFFYRKFIHKFEDIARPLHKLTEQYQRYDWSEECQAAFDQLKHALTSSPILSFPMQDGQFILDCEASNFGLGDI